MLLKLFKLGSTAKCDAKGTEMTMNLNCSSWSMGASFIGKRCVVAKKIIAESMRNDVVQSS